MCIHPRCDEPSVFLLKESKWGKEWELCEDHGPKYHEKGGGQLYRIKLEGKFIEPIEEEIQDGKGN
jgi:hypothetical protein